MYVPENDCHCNNGGIYNNNNNFYNELTIKRKKKLIKNMIFILDVFCWKSFDYASNILYYEAVSSGLNTTNQFPF
jgi:hypothetical protein